MKRLIFSIITSLIIVLGVTNVNASGSITVLDNEDAKYTVTREISSVYSPISNTFTYKVEEESGNPATVSGFPTTFNIVFNNTSPDASNKVSQSYTLNFAGTTFTEVGDYRFKVTETNSTNDSYPKSDESWEIDVSVRYKDNGTNEMEYTFVAPTKSGEAKSSEKTLKFTSESLFTNISISDSVKGNMANPDEYFKLKIIINGNNGDTYKIIGQDANVSYKGELINTSDTYKVGEENFVYLKHGQTITIGDNEGNNQISTGVTYRLILQDSENYKTYFNGSTTDSKDSGLLTALSNPDENDNIFINTFDKATKTGIFLTIAPYIVIVALAIIGIIFMVLRRKKEK